MSSSRTVSFNSLPAELRHLIWEFVGLPPRIIGLMPCVRADESETEEGSGGDMIQIVQPHNMVLPPVLQVCKESRSVMLRRLQKQEVHLQVQRLSNGGTVIRRIRTATPFVSYETDTFVVLGHWKCHEQSHDPFEGLQREKIRNIGVGEMHYGMEEVVRAVDVTRLPSLETLSFLVVETNPYMGLDLAEAFAVLTSERRFDGLRSHQYAIVDTVPEVMVRHIPLRKGLRPETIDSTGLCTRMEVHEQYIKALMKHTTLIMQTPRGDSTLMRYFIRAYKSAQSADDCPLGLQHQREDILPQIDRLEVKHKLVCEISWFEKAEGLGIASRTHDGWVIDEEKMLEHVDSLALEEADPHLRELERWGFRIPTRLYGWRATED